MSALVAAVSLLLSPCADVVASSEQHQIPGPASPAAQPEWLRNLKVEKEKALKKINYEGGVFNVPGMQWTQTSYIQPQMHPYDRYFYDPVTHEYTVEKYLQDLKSRYGGIDAMLMWPTYTNIGADDRNQWDLFRAMPGGLEAVTQVTKELLGNGVRTLWPYNPWDTGTHREPKNDEDTFAEILKQTGGAGFNGDTLDYVPRSFWDASVKTSWPIAFEPEGGGTDDALNWSTMGWGKFDYPHVPQLDRFKFLTSGRYMTNIVHRWDKSKTNQLQTAWFNGDGAESWENVWGTWNGIVPQDGEAYKRVATMLRFFGARGYLQSREWEPYVTEVINGEDVFASRWPLPSANSTLWSIVNRGTMNRSGPQLQVSNATGPRYFYDCYHGVELVPAPLPASTPEGYNKFTGLNAYSQHGAVDIDNDPVAPLEVEECTARCDADAQCGCVTYSADRKQCWKRANCEPAGFTSGAYDVYLKAQGYSTYTGKNTYSGHGAVDIESDTTAGKKLSVGECKARCDADRNCSCVTYRQSDRTCWKRAFCQPSGFASDSKYAVYLNEARVPRPPRGDMQLSFPIESGGYGCVLQTAEPASKEVMSFLGIMKTLTQTPLSSFSAEWKYLLQTMVPIEKTKAAASAPVGTVLVRRGTFTFDTQGVEIEGTDDDGVDLQYPWEDHPQRKHTRIMELGPFYMDKFPVTVANYSQYLTATGYQPRDPYNWLKNWRGSAPEAPAAIKDLPVTYVGLEEARAYCAWKGARLPHSYEWQYAAQGTDGRKYPWGNDKDQSKFPKLESGTVFPGPRPVTEHAPQGDSPFGVSDLVGNVWQYTDEFQDEHTRAVVLCGGSNYRPSGSKWYLPQALEHNTHEKYFLMDDRYERAGTIGFRCMVDAEEEGSTLIV